MPDDDLERTYALADFAPPAAPPAIELKPYQAAVRSNNSDTLSWSQPEAFRRNPITGGDRLMCRMVITLLDAYADLSRVTTIRENYRDLSIAAISDRIKLCMGIPMDSVDEYIKPDELDALWASRSPSGRAVLDFSDWLYSIRWRMQDDDGQFPWRDAVELSEPLASGSIYRASQSDEDTLRYFTFDWELREALRLRILNTRGVLPWTNSLTPIAGHYAHLTDEGQVRFTPDAAKGERAIHVLTKPGRYLRKYYPDLSNEEIEAWQAKADAATALHFARESDDIVRVYENGPPSCMSQRGSRYRHGHPCRVYGSGSDVTLAYLQDTSGKIVARTLVWEAKKLWCRVYGDHQRLKAKLDALGYQQGVFNGAKIHRIPTRRNSNTVVMPYIDLVQSFGEYDDKWFVIGGDYDAAITGGVSSLTPQSTCAYCDELIDGAAARATPDGDTICDSCFDDRYTTCDHTGDVVANDDTVEVVIHYCARTGGGWYPVHEFWALSTAEDDAFYCDKTEAYHASSRFDPIAMHNGDTWNSHTFSQAGYRATDGDNYPLGEGPGDEDEEASEAA